MRMAILAVAAIVVASITQFPGVAWGCSGVSAVVPAAAGLPS